MRRTVGEIANFVTMSRIFPVLTGTFPGNVDLSRPVLSHISLGYPTSGQLTIDQTG